MSLDRRHLLTLPLLLAAPALVRAEGTRGLVIQPLGKLHGAELEKVERALAAFYAVPIRVAPEVPLPKGAFYRPRARYRAEKLLTFLEAGAPGDARLVLGLTASDISTTKPPHVDWGVLGLATLDGRSAVLSSHRCHRRSRNVEHARIRFAKTAVHEAGHAFGLEHCSAVDCLMRDGEGSVLTLDSERDLCANCREKLARGGALRAEARSPFSA